MTSVVLQLRRDQHQAMKATIEQIRNITPAAIARIPIHFQIPPSSPSSGVMSPASRFSALPWLHSFRKTRQLSISNTRFRPFTDRCEPSNTILAERLTRKPSVSSSPSRAQCFYAGNDLGHRLVRPLGRRTGQAIGTAVLAHDSSTNNLINHYRQLKESYDDSRHKQGATAKNEDTSRFHCGAGSAKRWDLTESRKKRGPTTTRCLRSCIRCAAAL